MKKYAKIELDIYKDNISEDAQKLITEKLITIWPETYFADLNIEEYVPLVADLWDNYLNNIITIDAINKIKEANPPRSTPIYKGLKIYLEFDLFDDDDMLKLLPSEINQETRLFRVYIETTGDLWDTYVYNSVTKKFESLEIIEPAYVQEIKLSLKEQEKIDIDKLLTASYAFHNRLLNVEPKKILLYTSQPPDITNEWNTRGIIPKGTYFTDKMQRAEYFWEEGDVIVDYRIPADRIVITSDYGGAKEYVTIDDIRL